MSGLLRALSLLMLSACASRGTVVSPPQGAVDVIVVPGCPTQEDGRLSECQWRRAAWAKHLHETGMAQRFITSGGAAYTPYVEAETIAAGMIALGVPEERILRETQALHTDQNTGYALAIAQQQGFETVGMASDPGHSGGMCAMAARWGWTCTDFAMEYDDVVAVLGDDPPDVRLDPIPYAEWIGNHREPRMATSPRYTSFWYYTGVILEGIFTGSRPPKPPEAEPTE